MRLRSVVILSGLCNFWSLCEKPIMQANKLFEPHLRIQDTANSLCDASHYENMPIQTYCKFYHQKMKIFR